MGRRKLDKTPNRICNQCQNPFWSRPYDIKMGKGIYCSDTCHKKAMHDNIEPLISCICPICNKAFQRTREKFERSKINYCSMKCAGIAKSTNTTITCEYCGRQTKKHPSQVKRSNHYYCSKQCSASDMVGYKSPNWIESGTHSKYCHKFNIPLREEIRAKFNFKCYFCGSLETDRKHAVHHVDYQKSQGCNGKKWSLIPLCCKDHMRTNFYHWYWFCMLRDYWIYEYEGFDMWIPDKEYFKKNKRL